MTKYHNPAKVVTGVCRFSYANLWEAKAMDENSKPKYSVSLIIPKSDTKTIEKIRAAIQAAYEGSEMLRSHRYSRHRKYPDCTSKCLGREWRSAH